MGMDLLSRRSIAATLVRREVLLYDHVGLLTILWTIVWFSVIHESPSTHPTITKEELDYIESNLDRSAIRVNLLSY